MRIYRSREEMELHEGRGDRGDGGRAAGHRPSRFTRSGLRGRHVRAHVLVAAWIVLALLAATARQSLPVARWLAIHLFLLGAATTAVVVWSEHFAVALLHARRPDERWSDVRLAGVTLGAAGVVAGVWAEVPAVVVAGCALLVASVTAHLVVLVRLGRGALGGRLAGVAAFYKAGSAALIVGAVLGGLLATGGAGRGHYAGLRLAHIHVTLLGWLGLPVVGTLFMLWPTVLGVRMAERTTRVGRWVLRLAGGGLLVAVAGLALQWRWLAVAGVAGYAVGLGLCGELFARTAVVPWAHGRRPVSAAAVASLGAAIGWLAVGVVADTAVLAARPLAQAQETVGSGVLPVLIATVAQVLIGALTYLLPVVLGNGPRNRSALRSTLELAWPARLVTFNLGALLMALPLPAWAGEVGLVLTAAAGAVFLALMVAVTVRGGGTAGEAAPSSRWPAVTGTALGALVTVLAVVFANSGAAPGSSGSSGSSVSAVGAGAGGGAAGVSRTVDVTLSALRIRPSRVEVAAGTSLRLRVTNKDAQRHDLQVANGPSTPLLSDGESRTLDLGPITADRTAWCTVPGHRAAGMTMDIVVRQNTHDVAGMNGMQGDGSSDGTGGTGGSEGTGGTTATTGSGGAPGLDLGAPFSSGRRPRSAELAPTPAGKVHKLELHAMPRTLEVAPGVKQRMWTFGGTVPGPTLRGKVGDVFEITLVNDDPVMGHGIDFHAGSLSPDKAMRTLKPGGRLVYRFRAERAGAWLYHCSTMPMLQHMGNGMYGAVVVDPPDLPPVDHEFLLVSSELYLGTPGSAAQVAKMRQDTPDAWMFNGAAAQYAQHPLRSRAGDRVRFWVVAAGPSDGVDFHVVGTVFDTVYKEGRLLLTPRQSGGAQALDLAPAQGGYVETTFPAPGHYSFLDHDMRRAEAGARGVVEVTR